jgi:hypothetical protein
MAGPAVEVARNATQDAAPAVPKGGVLDEAIAATSTKRKGLVDGAAEQLGVAPDKLCNLLRSVWTQSKGQDPLTDAEMFVGISLVARFRLDPVSKEVYVIRTSKGLATIVALDGWVKILLRTDYYDGHTQETEWEDEAETKAKSIKTTIYSKTHQYPTVHVGYRVEYDRVAGVVNKSMPLHMLGIHSLKHAARKFVPLGGSVMTEEEAAYLNREHAPTDATSHIEQARAAADADASLAGPVEEPADQPGPSTTDTTDDQEALAARAERKEHYRGLIAEANRDPKILAKILTDHLESDDVLDEAGVATIKAEIEAAAKPKGKPVQQDLLTD